jgi:hypothetical protein
MTGLQNMGKNISTSNVIIYAIQQSKKNTISSLVRYVKFNFFTFRFFFTYEATHNGVLITIVGAIIGQSTYTVLLFYNLVIINIIVSTYISLAHFQ